MSKQLLETAALAGFLSTAVVLVITGGAEPLRAALLRVPSNLQSAATFFVPSITVAELQTTYGNAPSQANTSASSRQVRVLIVPGHEPSEGGTVFGGTYERDSVVDIADALAGLLRANPRYEVTIARTKNAWNPALAEYFDTHAADIEDFRAKQTILTHALMESGLLSAETDQVYHNAAPSETAMHLYGINKWTSEQQVDITIHLHINDYAGRKSGAVGKYDGFVMYVPEHQYSNAEASQTLGNAIAERLAAYHAKSTLPKEDAGVVEDQQLIAVGSNNTADSVALLIEYGYIYEPQFRDPGTRSLALADYAYETYLGIQDFFHDPVASTFGSLAFPYDWNTVMAKRGEQGAGMYALQAALHYLGYYPPTGKNFSDCPVSGKAGVCTETAIREYQSARGLEATGILGSHTRAALLKELAPSMPTPAVRGENS